MNTKSFKRVVGASSRRRGFSRSRQEWRKSFQRKFLVDLVKHVKPYLENGVMPPGGEVLGDRESIKKYSFHGVGFVIKNTGAILDFPPLHGRPFNSLRKNMLAFHEDQVARGIKDRAYILRFPKVYFRVGNFVVMKHVKEVFGESWENEEKFEKLPLYRKGRRQAREDILEFNRQRRSKYPLHRTHLIPAGFLNGKVILYVAVDSS
ncbi:MAG: hypothetical protein NTY48_02310 [Candidatus Diapherotrites archaeon]|nr:hypothetical protein [Candidatus Diapherotrites archaeon]